MVLTALGVYACSTYNQSLLDVSVDPSQAGGSGSGSGSGGVSGAEGGSVNFGGEPSWAGASPVEDAGAPGAEAGAAGEGGSAGAIIGGVAGSGGGIINMPGGMGGVAGSGGASPYETIDDFEDVNLVVSYKSNRTGYWYDFMDVSPGKVAVFKVDPGPTLGANGSDAALHFSASGFTVWGAGVGFDLLNSGGAKKVPYDVSKYSGIRFYAKVGTGAQKFINVLVPTTYSDPDGGLCDDSMPNKHCSQHLLSPVGPLKTTWDVYEVSFATLHQVGTGGLKQASLDPTSVYSFQFTVETPPTLPGDLWLDDLSFILK